MSRSIWKGPFVNIPLVKKINLTKFIVETRVRDCVVLPQLVGKIIKVHTGKKFTRVSITEDMIGHKLGEFATTRLHIKHKVKKKLK
jgi:small subunit ribosomal protein S19